jgi:hypothetical protein
LDVLFMHALQSLVSPVTKQRARSTAFLQADNVSCKSITAAHLHQEILQEVVEAAHITQPPTQHHIRALAARSLTLQEAQAAAVGEACVTPQAAR